MTVLKFCLLSWCSASRGFVSDSWATCWSSYTTYNTSSTPCWPIYRAQNDARPPAGSVRKSVYIAYLATSEAPHSPPCRRTGQASCRRECKQTSATISWSVDSDRLSERSIHYEQAISGTIAGHSLDVLALTENWHSAWDDVRPCD